MKKISSTKDLPKEFDLSKYDILSEMSDKDLFRQIYMRVEAYLDSMSGHFDGNDGDTYFLEQGVEIKVSFESEDPFGEIIVNPSDEYCTWRKGGRFFYDLYMEQCSKSLRVSTGYGIGYLSRQNLMYLSEMNDVAGSRKGMPLVFDVYEYVKDLNNNKAVSAEGALHATLNDSVTLLTDDPQSLLLSIDVSIPDDILLSEFKRLIPIWRKELKIDESESINSSWAIVRKKIIEYKIIPYIDLAIWSATGNSRIPHGIMAVALFPHGERDAFSIVQTIKPFIESLMTFESLEKLKQEISK